MMIAKTAYPEFFGEISVDHALEMLAEEATGSIPAGIFYYHIDDPFLAGLRGRTRKILTERNSLPSAGRSCSKSLRSSL